MIFTYFDGTARISDAGLFSPVNTFECGQCFRWLPDENGGYTGVAFGKAANVRVEDGYLRIKCDPSDFETVWRAYFDLDRDYEVLNSVFSIDDFTQRAVSFGNGMRILRQEPFETLISFIFSQCNNISRIRSIIKSLCMLSGEKFEAMGKTFFTFPTALKINSLSERELQSLRAGYRAPYVREAANAVLTGSINFNALRALGTEEARKEIMRLPGVGKKVADCFLLFGLQKYDAFPADVWIKKVFANYPGITPSRFGEFAGIAQQYFFYYARENKLESPKGEIISDACEKKEKHNT
ncbi:MAG: DNA glycosylase [Bacillota bacterium]|nr:DNA glycosylase [Bacillota bacterium]